MSAPSSAVAKFMTDIMQSPVQAAAIVTDFKESIPFLEFGSCVEEKRRNPESLARLRG